MCCNKTPSDDIPPAERHTAGPIEKSGSVPAVGPWAPHGGAPQSAERCAICGVSPGELPSASYLAQLRNKR